MIYSVTINQKAIADSGLSVNLQTAFLIGGIVQMTTNWQGIAKLEYDGRVFFWLEYKKLLSELPMLDMKEDSLYRALKAISGEDGFLIAHPNNKALKKSFYALSDKCYLLFGAHIGDFSEHSEKNPTGYNSLGKKSEYSEKSPLYIGKKSALTSEKNPMNNSILKNNNTEDKEEECTSIEVPSSENNSDEFFSQKKGASSEKNQKTESAPPTAAVEPQLAPPAADEKRKKVAAKKEKAPTQRSAITAEFERRGLPLFAAARNQPSDEWYSETVGKYGSANVWAIFGAMHQYCEDTGKQYTAPASAFATWAVSSDGYEVFEAIREYWRDTYEGEEWKELSALTKTEKTALDSLGRKFKARIAKKGLIISVRDNARQFFDNLPAKWANSWFKLKTIDEDMEVIYAEHRRMTSGAWQPQTASTGRTTAQGERVQKVTEILTKRTQQQFSEKLESATLEMLRSGKHDITTFRTYPDLYERLAAEVGAQIPSNFYTQ